mgnify:CR=1 FL=1
MIVLIDLIDNVIILQTNTSTSIGLLPFIVPCQIQLLWKEITLEAVLVFAPSESSDIFFEINIKIRFLYCNYFASLTGLTKFHSKETIFLKKM